MREHVPHLCARKYGSESAGVSETLQRDLICPYVLRAFDGALGEMPLIVLTRARAGYSDNKLEVPAEVADAIGQVLNAARKKPSGAPL